MSQLAIETRLYVYTLTSIVCTWIGRCTVFVMLPRKGEKKKKKKGGKKRVFTHLPLGTSLMHFDEPEEIFK